MDETPLRFGDGKALETIAKVLPKYLEQVEVSQCLDELRIQLLADQESISIKSLHQVTLGCRKCPAAKEEPKLPKWNVADPDCVFVVEQPYLSSDTQELFISSLKEAGFSSSRICLTYLNRCQLGHQADTEEVSNCVGYLTTEIQAMKPRLILPIGSLPATQVLGIKPTMEDVIGQVTWLGPWAVMVLENLHSVVLNSKRDRFVTCLKEAHHFVYGGSR